MYNRHQGLASKAFQPQIISYMANYYCIYHTVTQQSYRPATYIALSYYY